MQGWIQTSATSLHKLIKILGEKEFQNLKKINYIKFLFNSRPHFINISPPLPSSTFEGQEMLVMREKLARKPGYAINMKYIACACVKSAVLRVQTSVTSKQTSQKVIWLAKDVDLISTNWSQTTQVV